jgi:hypothetical protein
VPVATLSPCFCCSCQAYVGELPYLAESERSHACAVSRKSVKCCAHAARAAHPEHGGQHASGSACVSLHAAGVSSWWAIGLGGVDRVGRNTTQTRGHPSHLEYAYRTRRRARPVVRPASCQVKPSAMSCQVKPSAISSLGVRLEPEPQSAHARHDLARGRAICAQGWR